MNNLSRIDILKVIVVELIASDLPKAIGNKFFVTITLKVNLKKCINSLRGRIPLSVSFSAAGTGFIRALEAEELVLDMVSKGPETCTKITVADAFSLQSPRRVTRKTLL